MARPAIAERHEALREPQVLEPVADPERSGERERDDEVRGVDERERDVPSVDDARRVDVRLHPLGRRVAEEDEAVEVDHRLRLDVHPERVGGAAGEVVRGEDEDDRRPVEEQAADLPRRPADRRAREGAADPCDDQLALGRDPVLGAPGAEGDEVEAERAAPHRPPSGRSGFRRPHRLRRVRAR